MGASPSRRRKRSSVQPYTAVHKYYTRLRHTLRNNSLNPNDFISRLPDDVLVYILSMAGMKAAARTSLVSKRWRHVWTQCTDLDFLDPPTLAFVLPRCYQELRYHYPHVIRQYVNRVNQVIATNRAPVLSKFRVVIPLKNEEAPDIDKWLEFAFCKKVRNVELDFFMSPVIQFCNIISTNLASVMNTTLESLCLREVSINGPLLQWVLSNCPNLRRLTLQGCKTTTSDDASSIQKKLLVSSLNLEHLEFVNSDKILNTESLQICAPNLTSFKFSGPVIDVEYVSVPSLVDASFGGLYSRKIYENWSILSGFSSQLEKLSLQLYKVHFASNELPSFANVKQLELAFENEGDGLLSLTCSLIEACPLLHTFKLKMNRSTQGFQTPRQTECARIDGMCTLHYLETIEFVGYATSAYAARLAVSLTRHSPMLNKFIVDCRESLYVREPYKYLFDLGANDHADRISYARRRAEVLAGLIRPFGVDVVIL